MPYVIDDVNNEGIGTGDVIDDGVNKVTDDVVDEIP